MSQGNIYKPRYKIANLTNSKVWAYKNSYLRRFFEIRARRRKRGGLFRRCVLVAASRKWVITRRFTRPFTSRAGLRRLGGSGNTAFGRPRKRRYSANFYTKQQLRYFHGKIKEEAFRNLFRANRSTLSGRSTSFFSALESRLDRILYRRRFLPTIYSSHQFICYFGVEINGKLEHSPRSTVRVGDCVSISKKVWKPFFWDRFCRVYYRRWGLFIARRRQYTRLKKKLFRLRRRRIRRSRTIACFRRRSRVPKVIRYAKLLKKIPAFLKAHFNHKRKSLGWRVVKRLVKRTKHIVKKQFYKKKKKLWTTWHTKRNRHWNRTRLLRKQKFLRATGKVQLRKLTKLKKYPSRGRILSFLGKVVNRKFGKFHKAKRRIRRRLRFNQGKTRRLRQRERLSLLHLETRLGRSERIIASAEQAKSANISSWVAQAGLKGFSRSKKKKHFVLEKRRTHWLREAYRRVCYTDRSRDAQLNPTSDHTNEKSLAFKKLQNLQKILLAQRLRQSYLPKSQRRNKRRVWRKRFQSKHKQTKFKSKAKSVVKFSKTKFFAKVKSKRKAKLKAKMKYKGKRFIKAGLKLQRAVVRKSNKKQFSFHRQYWRGVRARFLKRRRKHVLRKRKIIRLKPVHRYFPSYLQIDLRALRAIRMETPNHEGIYHGFSGSAAKVFSFYRSRGI